MLDRLPQTIRPLTLSEEAALRDSIQTHGVRVPVTYDQHGRLIDGHHRERIAHELGVPCPSHATTVRDDDHALELAIRLNADRRQLAPEERQELVLSLRQQGHSYRAIAQTVGVDHATAIRDVRAGGADAPPELSELPETVTGRDGKTYQASAPADRMAVHYSSETPEWETPQELFDLLDSEFHFGLDVCATAQNAKCADFFTPSTDGLAQTWAGTCWMNPPYGQEIGQWVAKAFTSAKEGATVVCLVPARVDTGWWWEYARWGEVRFLRGRLRFGTSTSGAPFPSCVVVFGPSVEQDVVWWEPWR